MKVKLGQLDNPTVHRCLGDAVDNSPDIEKMRGSRYYVDNSGVDHLSVFLDFCRTSNLLHELKRELNL